jgi:integrase/recombinase XerC
LRVLQKSPLTIERYGDVLRELAERAGGRAPGDLRRDDLRRFAAEDRPGGVGRAPAGVNLRLAVLRAFFGYLVGERGLVHDPTRGLRGVREPRRTPKYLTIREAGQLVGHVAERRGPLRSRNLALVVLLWQTGLRVAEVARLRVAQLDRAALQLRDVLRKGGHVLDAELNPETIDILDAYLAERGELALDAPLFARADGHALSIRAIEALFATWRAELGWTRPLHPHVMRHSFATSALEDGAALATVAGLLGHQGLRTVLVYAHVQDPARRAAVARLGRHVPRDILSARPSRGAPVPNNVSPDAVPPCGEGPFDAAA